MGVHSFLFLFLAFLPWISGQDTSHAAVTVNGSNSIAETDDNFICATIDWWPHDKCNYNQYPWGYTSVINLNLSHPLLAKAVQAFTNLRIRIGGSLQDQVLYDVGSLKAPCHPFRKMKDGLFGFSKGCLHMDRWDELNQFFIKTRATVTFGLNALHGRQRKGHKWVGNWDPSNAQDLVNYTVSKGYKIESWEFGNELSGSGIGASVDVKQYGSDLIKLQKIISDLYRESVLPKPSLLAPGGFYDADWFAKLLQFSGPDVVNAVTHHIYNLGPGSDPFLVKKILNPIFLSKVSETYRNLKETILKQGPWASAWVGEAGGAFNSGGHHVSNTFVDSFWYLDQLGMSSKHNTKVYCRQTLIGGNYGLLNTTTFVPNPDYYGALLWQRLMGKAVLAVTSNASPYLRAYAHCSKQRAGITLLLINLSNQTKFIIDVRNSMTKNLQIRKESSSKRDIKKAFAWIGTKASNVHLHREEYHLTPKDGHLQSQTMLLNGKEVKLTDTGEIPSLEPELVEVKWPIALSPLSIAFVVVPNFDSRVCHYL